MTAATKSWILYALALSGLLVASRAGVHAFDQTHALFTTVLAQPVKEARVHYAALQAHPEALAGYLDQVAAVRRVEFQRWTESQQITFLCNGYNACTLRLIVDPCPVKSIMDSGSVIKGLWDQPVVRLFGDVITLNVLEHKILRVDYAEPRLHFAVICAAQGCPPLRADAYPGARLDEQLTDQAKLFLASPEHNRVVPAERTVALSPILKWYGADFEKKSGSVLAALQPYWPGPAVAAVTAAFNLRYTDYDWSLNDYGK
jgi:hypothetical protein